LVGIRFEQFVFVEVEQLMGHRIVLVVQSAEIVHLAQLVVEWVFEQLVGIHFEMFDSVVVIVMVEQLLVLIGQLVEIVHLARLVAEQ
jgi:hypothetical protein